MQLCWLERQLLSAEQEQQELEQSGVVKLRVLTA
jgi:hypothetical protein